ncbi:hypothetical protein DBR37_08680 [Herminiimonas sp. KBW02]|uniref:hypothetical protein n=1 Tax=Herminiimonas sp. KBW02 TaxID=2153363 RepID=UPI000F5A8DB1|nr:hypothetical protein [Herminiimonas sp. KBW02]RQO36376.1 hypothetical protein DBR37_08680 [Herminiimonas sp. KBW02]
MKTHRTTISVQSVTVNNEDGTLRVMHPLLASRARRVTHWLALQLGVERPHDAGLWLRRIFVRPEQTVNLTLQQVPDPLHVLATHLGVKNRHSPLEWLLRTFFIAPKTVVQQELRLSPDDTLTRRPAAAQKPASEQRYAA